MNLPASDKGTEPGMPRWVKAALITVVILALLAVAVMLVSAGEHGPGRHTLQRAIPPPSLGVHT